MKSETRRRNIPLQAPARLQHTNLRDIVNSWYASGMLNEILKSVLNCCSSWSAAKVERMWQLLVLPSGIWRWHLGLTVIWIHSTVWNSVWGPAPLWGWLLILPAISSCSAPPPPNLCQPLNGFCYLSSRCGCDHQGASGWLLLWILRHQNVKNKIIVCRCESRQTTNTHTLQCHYM